MVMLEALACGTPVAAYPVTGPIDVLGDGGAGAMNEDLREACLDALKIDRNHARASARSILSASRQASRRSSFIAPAPPVPSTSIGPVTG